MQTASAIKLRRASQILFLGLFLFLLLHTTWRGSLRDPATEIRLPYPVGLFLEIDPLIGLTNALATHALYRHLLWSLIILVPTFFLGRFFCGWICPLGTMHHFFSWLKSERKRGLVRLESNRYKPWQALKYYILVVVLLAALLGSLLAGVLDPIALTVRSLSLSLLPALNYGVQAMLEGMYGTGMIALQVPATALQYLLQTTLLSFKQPHFRQAFFLGAIFIALLAANLRITRFWCRALCPLGALLGVASRWSLLGLEKNTVACEGCNRCLLHCQGGDDPIPGAPWRKAECHLCLNCLNACPHGDLRFRWFAGTRTTVNAPDLKRRRLITSVAAGMALLPLLRTSTRLEVERHDRLIRPPGALDEKHFLERCIRCGACMKVCPNNALHPTLLEGGLEGIWTPVLVPRIGYCEPTCVLCSQVCPTGAIWEITQKEKLGTPDNETAAAQTPIKLGTAFFDRGRCLPWAMATSCIVCEEWCPTSPKAIYLQPAVVVDANGISREVKQPHVAPERCIGCGACEFACPVQDRPAIYVTSIGESRSKSNQILLQRRSKSE